MFPKKITNVEIGFLRDEIAALLGKNIRISNLELPETGSAARCILNTRNAARLVISRVELFPYLVKGTQYKKRFNDGDRTAGRTFTFQTFGAPAVSIVLPNQTDAIGVIKRMIGESGKEQSWTEILAELGADRSQFQHFLQVADNVDINSSDSTICLEDISGFDDIRYDITEHPNPKVKNLDAIIHLSAPSRRRLQELLRAEEQGKTGGTTSSQDNT